MRLAILMVIALVATLAMATAMISDTGVVSAHGNSPARLTAAGWECFLEEEDVMVICAPPGAFTSSASFIQLIFDTDDVTATDAPLIGMDVFLRSDLYHGQPCPQFGLDNWIPLDFDGDGATDFFACPHPFGGFP